MNSIACIVLLASVATVALASQCYCPDNYTPLCGSDGKTYANPCEFNCLTPFGQVKIVKAGECDQPREEDLPCICNRMYTPVCGSDGHTYDNMCEFNCAAVKEKLLRVVYEGECAQARKNCFCPPIIYAPVCGTDMVTYPNLCAMECANVQMAHQGECF